MTLNQFLLADEMAQVEAVWRAKLVKEKADKEFMYTLYQIDDFFVKVRSRKKDMSLCNFECFEDEQSALIEK